MNNKQYIIPFRISGGVNCVSATVFTDSFQLTLVCGTLDKAK